MRALLRLSLTLIVVFGLIMLPRQSWAQRSVEAYGAIGATVVDVDKWAGISVRDWTTGMSGWSIQAFVIGNDLMAGGLEYGYSYLMWYTFYDGYFDVERNVSANRVMAVGRLFPKKKLITEVGAGLYLFDGFADITLAAGIGYKIHITEGLSIPIKVRFDAVLDREAFMLPVGVNAGVAYSF